MAQLKLRPFKSALRPTFSAASKAGFSSTCAARLKARPFKTGYGNYGSAPAELLTTLPDRTHFALPARTDPSAEAAS